MSKIIYDLAILGGGPAGAAAGVYAARKQLKTVIITKDWYGQSSVSEGIENWIGEIKISGMDLSKKLEDHVKHYAGTVLTSKSGEHVTELKHNKDTFIVTTSKDTYEARAVLIATGSSRKTLDVPGAREYDNKGLTYCASCDGPMYSGQDVAVIGGGNAAFESAAQLLAYCRSVTVLVRSEVRADEVTVKKLLSDPKMKLLKGVVPKEVKGDKFVNGLVITDTKTGKETLLNVSGIFVEIGSVPNTDYAKSIVGMNEHDHIIVDAKNQRTSVAGIWSAGDCTDGLFHQNNIAAGDAVKAVEDIYLYLRAR